MLRCDVGRHPLEMWECYKCKRRVVCVVRPEDQPITCGPPLFQVALSIIISSGGIILPRVTSPWEIEMWVTQHVDYVGDTHLCPDCYKEVPQLRNARRV